MNPLECKHNINPFSYAIGCPLNFSEACAFKIFDTNKCTHKKIVL